MNNYWRVFNFTESLSLLLTCTFSISSPEVAAALIAAPHWAQSFGCFASPFNTENLSCTKSVIGFICMGGIDVKLFSTRPRDLPELLNCPKTLTVEGHPHFVPTYNGACEILTGLVATHCLSFCQQLIEVHLVAEAEREWMDQYHNISQSLTFCIYTE